MSAGRAQPQARFPQENSRFRVCAALTARAATWRRRINCERCRFQGETIPADPLGCTDDATVSFFQPLIPDREPVRLPVQELDSDRSLVSENEQVPRLGV